MQRICQLAAIVFIATAAPLVAQTPRPAGDLALPIGPSGDQGAVGEGPTHLSELRGRVVMLLHVVPPEGPTRVPLSAVSLQKIRTALDTPDLFAVAVTSPGIASSLAQAAIACAIAGGGDNCRLPPLIELDDDTWRVFAQVPAGEDLGPHLVVIDRDGVIQQEFPANDAYWDDPESNLRQSADRWLDVPAQNAPPRISENGIVDAASFAPLEAPHGLALGGVVAIFGERLAGTLEAAATSPLPFELGGVRVEFEGGALPLFFVSPTQINVQLPYRDDPERFPTPNCMQRGQQARTCTFTVVSPRGRSADVEVDVDGVSSSIYTLDQSGSGQAVVVHAGSTTLAAPVGSGVDARPILPGDVLTVYANSIGPVSPPIQDGRNSCEPDGICDPDFGNLVLRSTTIDVSIEIGGVPLAFTDILFSGLAPEFAGLYQINFVAPEGLPAGDSIPITLTTGARRSQPDVTVAVGAP